MKSDRGFALISILTALALTGLLMAGALKMLSAQTEVHTQQDLAMELEQNLRVGLDQLGDAVRTAGSAAPQSDLAAWVTWVPGFDDNPHISGSPTALSVARCTDLPVAALTLAAAAGDVSLSVASEVTGSALLDLLDEGARSLIAIDDFEHALVRHVGTSSIGIDTDPNTAGDQGLSRAYPAGTPICRVDVRTYSVLEDATGRPQLSLDLNQGAGPEPFADSISELRVIPVVAGARYEIFLTGRSPRDDPMTGAPLQRTLKATVLVRNAG